jgi:hypothetical protein
MTPKEKAQELIEKMHTIDINDAKQCALIAVDEIIEELAGMWGHYANIESQTEERQSYWFKVKKEIQKL